MMLAVWVKLTITHVIVRIQETVEVEAKIVGEKGRLISVTVEIKKKDNAELVAVGRVWFTTDNINRYPGDDEDTTITSKL